MIYHVIYKGQRHQVAAREHDWFRLVGDARPIHISSLIVDASLPAYIGAATEDETRKRVFLPEHAQKGQAGGLKFDAGKDQWGLLLSGKGMLNAVRGVVRVLMFGAKKYAAHSWREVEDNERRYLDGLMRHYSEIMEHGLDARDSESGLLHIDHLNCNGLFLGELARKKKA